MAEKGRRWRQNIFHPYDFRSPPPKSKPFYLPPPPGKSEKGQKCQTHHNSFFFAAAQTQLAFQPTDRIRESILSRSQAARATGSPDFLRTTRRRLTRAWARPTDH